MGIPLPIAKTKAGEISEAVRALNAAIKSGAQVGLTTALMVTDNEMLRLGASVPQVIVTISGDPRAFEP